MLSADPDAARLLLPVDPPDPEATRELPAARRSRVRRRVRWAACAAVCPAAAASGGVVGTYLAPYAAAGAGG